MIPRGAGLLVLLALLGGCATGGGARREVMRRLPRSMMCGDGFPVRILVGRDCPQGFCGYTCAPERWHDEKHEGDRHAYD